MTGEQDHLIEWAEFIDAEVPESVRARDCGDAPDPRAGN